MSDLDRDELDECFKAYGIGHVDSRVLADALVQAGFRKIFDGDCGLSNIKDPAYHEAAEAWMRWANLASADGNGIAAMRQMLKEFGYRKPRIITTAEELDALPSGSAIIDVEGEVNVLHDNGWVLPGGGGGYTTWAVAQSLPVTVLHEPDLSA